MDTLSNGYCYFYIKAKALFIGIALLFSFSSQAQELGVAPSRIFFSGTAGQTVIQQVELSNHGTAAMAFTASLKDWERDSLGNKIYREAGTLAKSNAAWIEVVPNSLELEPGTSKKLTISMHIPSDITKLNHVSNSMLLLGQVTKQVPNTTDGSGRLRGVGINVKLEVGIHVYYTPPGAVNKNIDLIAFNDQKMPDASHRLGLKLQSKGDMVTDGAIRFEVTNKATGEEMSFPPRAFSMMPGTEQMVYLYLPATLKGRFLVVAIQDSGLETNLKVAEKEVLYN